MKIKLSSNEKKLPLWKNSPCTLRYVSENYSLPRTERFKVGSIYQRDPVDQQKKVFTQFERPQLLLQNFRRQIEDAGHSKYRTISLKKTVNHSENAQNNQSLTSISFNSEQKLYKIPDKLELLYDRNGVRSNYVGQYNVKQIKQRIKSTKSNFSSGRRVDLGKPFNFYPGPGTYFKIKESSNKKFKRIFGSDFKPSEKSSYTQPLITHLPSSILN